MLLPVATDDPHDTGSVTLPACLLLTYTVDEPAAKDPPWQFGGIQQWTSL